MKQNKELIILTIILVLQTIIFIISGLNKSYLHMDEAFSMGLTNYDKIKIQSNDDFYDKWHTKEYYEDYLTVNKEEKYDFRPVYENQKNDVHPPLYYLLLRIAMQFHLNSYSKWPGIILNIIIYVFVTIFMYLITKKILYETNNCIEKSAIIAFISSITLASISNAIYIRMYALSTLDIIITTYLHLVLLDKKENNNKLLVAIGLSALFGSLTHYYYLFYLGMLFIMLVTKFIYQKEYKLLRNYIITMCIAGVTSIIIFPYSIKHMFFGYRGQGAIHNLINISKFLKRLWKYICIINLYAFNNILFILLAFLLVILIYKKIKKTKLIERKNKYIKFIIFPTLFYFVLVAISSPWIELRYIMPICGLAFIVVLYCIFALLENIIKEKNVNKIILGIILFTLIMPIISNIAIDFIVGTDFRREEESLYSNKQEFISKLRTESKLPSKICSKLNDNTLISINHFKLEPEVLYYNKNKLVKFVENNSNAPAIYLLNSKHNRFLDDILLFAIIKDSYIAKNIECTENNINEILLNRNISNGLFVFINNGQKNEELLNTIRSATNLEKSKYLFRLNACDVYFLEK